MAPFSRQSKKKAEETTPVAVAPVAPPPVAKTEAPERVVGRLVSTIDHPVMVTYGGELVRVSPRATLLRVVQSKLGPLPQGIRFLQD